jgi:hypothetical protein
MSQTHLPVPFTVGLSGRYLSRMFLPRCPIPRLDKEFVLVSALTGPGPSLMLHLLSCPPAPCPPALLLYFSSIIGNPTRPLHY